MSAKKKVNRFPDQADQEFEAWLDSFPMIAQREAAELAELRIQIASTVINRKEA